jgi:hypothetical protein
VNAWGPAGLHLSQSSIRGDFNLPLLKKSLKKRYSILPNGDHAFQAMLKKYRLEQSWYGHIIEVEDGKDAMWLKLSYDLIGKPGTEYVGAWRDIEVEAVQDVLTQLDERSEELQKIQAIHTSVSLKHDN